MSRLSSTAVLIVGAAAIAGAIALGASAQAPAPAAASAMPRTADGHPDLQGQWSPNGVNKRVFVVGSGGDSLDFPGRGGVFQEGDGSLTRTSNVNKPIYRPQFWDEITDNEYNGNWLDPIYSCVTLGVPRLGAPHAIYYVAGQPKIILLYQGGVNVSDVSFLNWDVHRVIWTDGRPHNLINVAEESLMGDSVAHWEGDTLVIETIGFSDATWLHKNGWIHGFDMKVTERITRNGNQLVWNATVEDPEYLQEPWKMTPMVRNLNTDPNAWLGEELPCEVRGTITTHERS